MRCSGLEGFIGFTWVCVLGFERSRVDGVEVNHGTDDLDRVLAMAMRQTGSDVGLALPLLPLGE